MLTFGAAALGVLGYSRLIVRGNVFPASLGKLGYLSGVLLLVVYLGRLVALDPKNPALLVPALLEGFVVSPAWFVWLGRTLSRAAAAGGARV